MKTCVDFNLFLENKMFFFLEWQSKLSMEWHPHDLFIACLLFGPSNGISLFQGQWDYRTYSFPVFKAYICIFSFNISLFKYLGWLIHWFRYFGVLIKNVKHWLKLYFIILVCIPKTKVGNIVKLIWSSMYVMEYFDFNSGMVL